MGWTGDGGDGNWYLNKDMNYHTKENVMDDKKYFSAQEAREISDAVKGQQMKDELDWIYEMIDKARFDGKHEIVFSNKTLMKATNEFLKAKGFKISHFSGTQWDPADDTTISW